jgi:uncharacterized protein (UPF0276 family)
VLGERHAEGPVTIEGVGLGLRWEFLDELVARSATSEALAIDFLEISPENYIGRGGRPTASLASLAQRYSLLSHGLTLSIGGIDPLDGAYLREVAAFVRDIAAPWHSDHLCFGAVDGRALHDLLPVAFKRASVQRIADRIRRARDVVGVPLAIENVSYYWHPGRAEMGEAEFLAMVCEAADCGLMLDVNNAYVNATNFHFDVDAWMRTAPLERAVQIHVAGHEWFALDERGSLAEGTPAHTPGALIVDTHGTEVPNPVLSLLSRVLARTGPLPIVLERDQNVPDLDTLLAELRTLREIAETAREDPTTAAARTR